MMRPGMPYTVLHAISHIHNVALRTGQVEMNYLFLMQFFATFAELGVPGVTAFKAGFGSYS